MSKDMSDAEIEFLFKHGVSTILKADRAREDRAKEYAEFDAEIAELFSGGEVRNLPPLPRGWSSRTWRGSRNWPKG